MFSPRRESVSREIERAGKIAARERKIRYKRDLRKNTNSNNTSRDGKRNVHFCVAISACSNLELAHLIHAGKQQKSIRCTDELIIKGDVLLPACAIEPKFGTVDTIRGDGAVHADRSKLDSITTARWCVQKLR